jgi:hypothetical protein
MAKICVQCEKKIGLFKSPIDGIYCTYSCREAARKDIAESERRAAERKIEEERAAKEAEARAAEAAKRAKAEPTVENTCPKCGPSWKHTDRPGGGYHGKCDRCGLSADFDAIEKCPTGTGMSLLVQVDAARCPRCKFRRS